MANFNPIQWFRHRRARQQLSPAGKTKLQSLSKNEQEQFYALSKIQQQQFNTLAEKMAQNSPDRVMEVVNHLPRQPKDTMSVYHQLAEKAKQERDTAEANLKSLLSGLAVNEVELRIIDPVDWAKELEAALQLRAKQQSYRQHTPLSPKERQKAKAAALALLEQKQSRHQGKAR